MKVIRFVVDNYRSADDFVHMEAACEDFHVSLPMIGQQRRQISRMIWVHCPAGIKMAAGIGEALPVTVFPSWM